VVNKWRNINIGIVCCHRFAFGVEFIKLDEN